MNKEKKAVKTAVGSKYDPETDKFTRVPYLWEVEYRDEFDESQEAFIQTMMQENLNHARHVENERMSLLVGISALLAGVLAVGGTMITQALSADNASVFFTEMIVSLFIFSVSLGIIVLSSRLNKRWNVAFGRHINYAKSCYFLIHRSNFELTDQGSPVSFDWVEDNLMGDVVSDLKKKKNSAKTGSADAAKYDEKIKEIEDNAAISSATAFNESFRISSHAASKTLSTMPLYCFDINKNIDENGNVDLKSTKKYFNIFYSILTAISAATIVASLAIMAMFPLIIQ